MIDAAGFVLQAKDTRRILVMRRRDGRWDLPGGRAEPDDMSPFVTACRELVEETSYDGTVSLTAEELVVYEKPKGKRYELFADYVIVYGGPVPRDADARYVAFFGEVPAEFVPRFEDGEHDAYEWITEDEAAWRRRSVSEEAGSSPRPMHRGAQFVLGTCCASFG